MKHPILVTLGILGSFLVAKNVNKKLLMTDQEKQDLRNEKLQRIQQKSKDWDNFWRDCGRICSGKKPVDEYNSPKERYRRIAHLSFDIALDHPEWTKRQQVERTIEIAIERGDITKEEVQAEIVAAGGIDNWLKV